MMCEICDTQPATMWVEMVRPLETPFGDLTWRKPVMSCDDCGPRLGYKVLASVVSVARLASN